MAEKPLSTVIVEVKCVSQWGGVQQKSITQLLYWHAAEPDTEILKVEDLVHRQLSQLEFGEFAALSTAAESAFNQLGRGCQLTLKADS